MAELVGEELERPGVGKAGALEPGQALQVRQAGGADDGEVGAVLEVVGHLKASPSVSAGKPAPAAPAAG